MKIHEDRSHMNIDTRWFEKGYAKEDVHSLRCLLYTSTALEGIGYNILSMPRQQWNRINQMAA